ncbi:DinB family protein [Rossellomorea oryzaecorticis]|uniref:DinB family protein n=1 Tax=Rossellomorea oryzaecorticis TaxID=1396505 RepID=A0ABU9KC88_9BACI
MKKEELLDHHDYFISWLNELNNVEEDKWYAPMEEGKWSIAANVSHIIKWDQYSLEHILLPSLQEGAVLPAFPEFEEFNRKAAAYAHNEITHKHLLKEGIETRKSTLAYIDSLTEEELDLSFEVGDHHYTLREFFEDFMGHDKHHQNQIEEALYKEKA